jgi:peptide/nickel transport system substrate-binding protein
MKKLLTLLPIILLLCAVCTKKVEPIKGESGGRLVIGTTDLPATLSPLAPSIFGSNDILDLLFMSLHRIDPKTGKMQPELAMSWEFSEDLTSITYYLRTDVKWWDGQPVTAEDVLFTYERMKDPKTNYPNAASLRFIKDVKVVGTYAVRFSFDRIYADLLTDSDIMPVPKHVYDKLGAENFGLKPVGNGPYKVKDFVPGSYLVLTDNEAYYRGRPPLDEMEIRYYADIEAMKADFAQGNLDLVLNINPLIAGELAGNKNISIDSKPGNTFTYVGWNLTNEFLADKDFRKALTMAINRSKILTDIFSGMGKLSLGPLPPSSWGFNESIAPMEFNLAKAREILKQKGYQEKNGFFEKGNKPLTLTIITNSENPERVQILNQVASDQKSLGIKVNSRAMRVDSFIAAVVTRKFDGFIMGWSVGDKIDPSVYWHSEAAKGRYNFSSYKNKKVDSLIEVGVTMLNRKKAKEIWGEFQKTVYDDQPYSFLIVPNEISALYKRVRGAEEGVKLASAFTYWIPESERRLSVAATTPTTTTPTTPTAVKPETTATKPATPVTIAKPTTTPKPPVVTTPEKLLEAAAKKETTAVVTVPPVTPPPVTAPKPSVITQAKPVKQINARYPEAARSLGATGKVVVRVMVGTDGKVKSAVVISSFGNPACEEAALAAARQWEFDPAKKDGVPFEQNMAIPFTFKP